ncbi:MAG: Xaa-Pro peptidase family protein [Oscillospiraceae bacterium]
MTTRLKEYRQFINDGMEVIAKTERITQSFTSCGADVCIIKSPLNLRYLTGIKLEDSMAVLTATGRKILLTDGRYGEICAKNLLPVDFEVLVTDDIYAVLAKIAKAEGFTSAALETDYITMDIFCALKEIGCAEKIVPISQKLRAIRSVKSDEEIKNIRTAQQIGEASFNKLLTKVRVGMSEKEIAAKLTQLLLKNGSDNGEFGICCVSGENSSLVHGGATDKKIQKGDNILLDFGAIYKGYYSDMTRTFCVGEPSQEFKAAYEVVKKANEQGIKQLRDGAVAGDIDAVARGIIDGGGYKGMFVHSLGHGVGMDIHDAPRLAPNSTDILRTGNVVTIEPGIYIPGRFGIRIEDMLGINEMGADNFTSITKQLIVL